jgi:hypothetical protein
MWLRGCESSLTVIFNEGEKKGKMDIREVFIAPTEGQKEEPLYQKGDER